MFGTNLKNTCTFIGRIAKPAEINTYQGQNGPYKIAYLTIAVDRKMTKDEKKNAEDNGRPTTDFVRVKLGGKQVDFIENYMEKGMACIVECNYETYTKTDKKTGETVYGHTFNVNTIEFTVNDSKAVQNSRANGGGKRKKKSYSKKQSRSAEDDFDMFGDDEDDDDEWDDDDNPW